jgi:hypothetical protein
MQKRKLEISQALIWQKAKRKKIETILFLTKIFQLTLENTFPINRTVKDIQPKNLRITHFPQSYE